MLAFVIDIHQLSRNRLSHVVGGDAVEEIALARDAADGRGRRLQNYLVEDAVAVNVEVDLGVGAGRSDKRQRLVLHIEVDADAAGENELGAGKAGRAGSDVQRGACQGIQRQGRVVRIGHAG